MPRHNTHQNLERTCKIRKRVSSSSSSSSVVKNYRFKRAILVGKRAGSSTPVPTWKVIMAGSKSPMQKLQSFENGVKYTKEGACSNNNNNKCKEGLSARKLAATLWEINGFNSPGGLKEEIFQERRKKSSEKSGKIFDVLDQHLHSPVCEKIDGSKVGGHRRRSSTTTSQKLQITECFAGGLDTAGKASSMEVSSHVPGENNSSIKTRLKDVNNSLIASKELVKVLFRILSQEEQQSSRLTLVSALKIELDRARLQVDQLIQEQRCNSKQIDALLKRFAEEKAAWRSREKERIRELEIERKLRRQAERLNKKLGEELGDTRAHFSRVVKKLEGEKRAREILEQTCDELARGIGEERVEVEELKKESEKVREEVEKERKMLQLADVLREERVQMKLAEARYEYEEKNAALERLRGELETYLKNEARKENEDVFSDFDLKIDVKDFLKKTQFKEQSEVEARNENEGGSPDFDVEIDIKDFLKKTRFRSLQNGEKEQSEGDGREEEEEESGDSELHSIELNMDNNNKSYKWSFACDGTTNQGDSRRASTDEVFKGRKSLSEKIQWENICLQRKTSDGIERDFTANKQENVNGFDTNDEKIDNEDDFKRYKLVKSQRLPSFQGLDSPAMSTGRSSSRLREACTAILQDLAFRREKIEGHCVGNKR